MPELIRKIDNHPRSDEVKTRVALRSYDDLENSRHQELLPSLLFLNEIASPRKVIPKKIHFIWLSGEQLPAGVLRCMDSWKKHLPDYEIKRWDISSFNINSIPFVKEACARRKWAFAADYIRLYALHTEGGIYMDSDVLMTKSYDPFLAHKFFTSIESHGDSQLGLQAAIFGSIANHPFLKECMAYYEAASFKTSAEALTSKDVAPTVYAKIALKYGLALEDKRQSLKNGIEIFPSSVFASTPAHKTRETISIHYCAGSWRDTTPPTSTGLVPRLKRNRLIRQIFGKAPQIHFK